MNDLTTTNDKQVLRVHNNFIQAIFSLSVDAKKLLLTIWLHTNSSGKNIQIYRAEIMKKVGIDLKNLSKEHREKIIEELMTKIITIRDIDNPNNFTKIQLVYKTKYENGILYTNIDEDLMKYIKEAREKLFTRFNIQNIKPLTSTYAIRIYLLCKQYQDTGWLKMTLDDFKKKFELEYKYKQIFDLKRRVLEVAKKQINENTDITIDYELEKQGRKYTHITFKIKSKNKKKEIKDIKKEVKQVGTDSSTDNSFNSFRQDFNSFRQEILSKVDENKVIILDDKTYQIKNNYLFLNNKILNKEEALEYWNLLFENKDKLKILSKEEIKELKQKEFDKFKEIKEKIEELKKNYKYLIVKFDGEEREAVLSDIVFENNKFITYLMINNFTTTAKFDSIEKLERFLQVCNTAYKNKKKKNL
jgi:plasmid replication initiation protein